VTLEITDRFMFALIHKVGLIERRFFFFFFFKIIIIIIIIIIIFIKNLLVIRLDLAVTISKHN